MSELVHRTALVALLLVLACQPVPQVPSGAKVTPAAASRSRATVSSAPGANTSQDPRAVRVPEDCPKQTWADSLPSSSDGVGSVLLGALGLSVSEEAGRAPNKRLNGAPAVVVEQGAAGYRLIGSDGTIGWAAVSGPFVAAGVSFEDPNVELFSVLFEPPSAAPENLQTTAVGADFARIIGASSRPMPEFMWQLGTGAWNHDPTSPWFRVESPKVGGWLPPSATRIVWQVVDAQRCNPFANLHGLARGSSLARAKRALAEWAPKPGTVLQAWQGAPRQVDSCTVDAAIFPTESASPALVQFDCGGSAVFAYTAAGDLAHFMLDDDRAAIVRYEFADVSGDAKPELLLEVGLSWSHDYMTRLFILPSNPTAKGLGSFPLSGLEEDTAGGWSLSATAREVNVSRTSGRKIAAIRLVDRGTANQATDTPLSEQPGFLALFSQHDSLRAAQRQALADPQAMVLPLSTTSPSFATGNVFASQRAACAALAAHRTTPAVRALGINRPCQGINHKN